MSTSPSWFDQDKFARLNKKAGSKPTVPRPTVTPPPAVPVAPGPLLRAYIPDPPADPDRVSTLPPINLPQTGALPHLKPVFNFPAPLAPPADEIKDKEQADTPDEEEPATPAPVIEESLVPIKPQPRVTLGFDPPAQEIEMVPADEDFDALHERIAALRQELGEITDQRDESLAEQTNLRRQLREVQEADEDRANLAAQMGDFSQAAQERDEARLEAIVLRDQLQMVEQAVRDRDALASQVEELSHVIEERDAIRHDFATLREQFETLKHDRTQLPPQKTEPPIELTEQISTQKKEIEQLREQLEKSKQERERTPPLPDTQPIELTQKLAAQEKEIALLRAQLVEHDREENSRAEVKAKEEKEKKEGSAASETELGVLQEQLKAAKEEAILGQRGLALSQKALQETRDALREASEGTSTFRGNFDNLKSECATLVQQNLLLQAQHDQLSRELSAAKAKIAAKG